MQRCGDHLRHKPRFFLDRVIESDADESLIDHVIDIGRVVFKGDRRGRRLLCLILAVCDHHLTDDFHRDRDRASATRNLELERHIQLQIVEDDLFELNHCSLILLSNLSTASREVCMRPPTYRRCR